MSEKNYSTADIQAVANGIRKQILGVALKTGGCYLAQACSSAEIIASLYTRVMNLGPSVGSSGSRSRSPAFRGRMIWIISEAPPITALPHRIRIVSSYPAATMLRLSTPHWQRPAASAQTAWTNSM